MIETISHKLAIIIKESNPDQTASIEIMKFSIIGIINNTITFLFIFIIGFIGGHFIDAVIALFSFMLLRLFAGGFHFNSSTVCIIVSTLSISFVPYLSLLFNLKFTLLLNVICFLINLVFSPSNVKKTRIQKKNYKIYKLISLLIVTSNFLFLSPVVSLAFFTQSISIIERREEII